MEAIVMKGGKKTLNSKLKYVHCNTTARLYTNNKFKKKNIFKVAVETPVNKSGDKTNIADNRSMSILVFFNKYTEKIIHKN